MPLSTSVLFFASLSLELYYLIKRRISIYIFIYLFDLWKIVGLLLAVPAIMPVLALPSTPIIIIERGTFGLICDGSRRPRGHIPPPYSLNGQDSDTACDKYNSLLNDYLDLDWFGCNGILSNYSKKSHPMSIHDPTTRIKRTSLLRE